MSWWDEKAVRLQSGVRWDEQHAGSVYDQDDANRAVVHSREDIVLIVSQISSANRQLASIRLTLKVIAVILVAIGVWLAYHLR